MTTSTHSSMNARTQHQLDGVDELLARDRPFGDSDYVHAELQVRYERRLEKISARLPVAGELVRALEQSNPHSRYRLFGDPVLRYTVQQALRQIVRKTGDGLPLAECEEIFRGAVRHLEEGKSGGPLESNVADASRLGADPRHACIWSEAGSDDVFGRAFRKVVRDNFPAEAPCTPLAVDRARLAKGAELLGLLLPQSSRSALCHAHVVVVFRGRKASCSEFRVAGAVLINGEMLQNPWWVAEHLLHESLHQKLYDFRHTHSLLAEDLSPRVSSKAESAAPIYSIWNAGGREGSNRWDIFRGIAALHVYVHLALLCLQAERRKAELVEQFGAPDGSLPALIYWHKTFERAQYLGRTIKERAWRELGPAGQLLVDWLTSTLNKIDPSPPPPASPFVHLLLDRYVIEARMVATKKVSPAHTTALLALVGDEATTIHRVLSAAGAGRPDLDRLDDAVARRCEESAEATFLRFRSVAAKILHAFSPDSYGLRCPSSADPVALEETIRAMVETSSQELIPLLDQGAGPR